MIRAVLFDLDGTLADTAADLARALNAIRVKYARPALPLARIRPLVSLGAAAMLKLAFAVEPEDADFAGLRAEFLNCYAADIVRETRLFEGMESVLNNIEARAKWGIVTNKPAWLTDPLLRELRLDRRAACVVSGDTLAERKPHPAPVLHACRLIGVAPAETVFIGDAERDIQAGRGAGARTLVAAYGYLADGAAPEDWRADGIVQSPLEIKARLREFRA